ncbi:MAG TPA: glycosyltransferase, partial [Flavobacteriales bacterium]|nr:glycosyltransferase [Flavobacteriales bacterium]
SGRHPRIRHLGFIQAEALPAIMADCGVFILPSTYEPWGVVVQENACAGFPLLLSDAVGAAERFLHEGENGHLFRAGDRSSIKQAMLRMVHANDDRLRAMGLRSASIGISWNPDQWAAVAMGLIR